MPPMSPWLLDRDRGPPQRRGGKMELEPKWTERMRTVNLKRCLVRGRTEPNGMSHAMLGQRHRQWRTGWTTTNDDYFSVCESAESPTASAHNLISLCPNYLLGREMLETHCIGRDRGRHSNWQKMWIGRDRGRPRMAAVIKQLLNSCLIFSAATAADTSGAPNLDRPRPRPTQDGWRKYLSLFFHLLAADIVDS